MPRDVAIEKSGSDGVDQVRRFLVALAHGDVAAASAELSSSATYHVPGGSSAAGTLTGRKDIVTSFQQLFGFLSGSEALKWVDWMVGSDLVSVLVDTHLQSGLAEFEGRLLFVFSSNPSGAIADIRLFLEDQARFDRFFTQSDV